MIQMQITWSSHRYRILLQGQDIEDKVQDDTSWRETENIVQQGPEFWICD